MHFARKKNNKKKKNPTKQQQTLIETSGNSDKIILKNDVLLREEWHLISIKINCYWMMFYMLYTNEVYLMIKRLVDCALFWLKKII